MARLLINVYLTIDSADLHEGWNGDDNEFAKTVEATLHELNGDDGGVYVPTFVGLDIETDEVEEVGP